MEILNPNSVTTLMEIDVGDTPESLQRYVESQTALLNNQVDQLHKIVVTQCKLTGVNPLSQEMAAGALSINIGKRPRDLLNPKAVKYMQAVFSIKDTLTKKETREISALCGVTITQVREFFAGQRSRVRKLVKLSRDKAIKSEAVNNSQDGCLSSSDLPLAIINPIPLNSMEPKTVEESPACSVKEEIIPGIDDYDKDFVTNIFNLMRKEGTFSGEVKLMEWILKIQNSSVLYWFVDKGGVMILAAWLSQAALEEQTTVLLVILKVLCHLPLHKALPVQMSSILQTVNRLRFYRTSDISNKAKVLLSRWSKMFVRSQALRKPIASKFRLDAQKVNTLQQSSEVITDWQSNIDLPEEILSLAYECTEDSRKSESCPPLKLLQASPDDSNKKQIRGVSSIQTRERRKVMPMEQPDWSTTSRSPQITRVMPLNQGRPMSADDIQKAKMRAIHMQSKYGKIGASPTKKQQLKTEDSNKSSISQSNHLLSALEFSIRSKPEEGKKPAILASDTSYTPPKVPTSSKPSISPQQSLQDKPGILVSDASHTPQKPLTNPMPRFSPQKSILEKPDILASGTSHILPKALTNSKPRISPQQSLLEKLKSNQIRWHPPREIRINSLWRVGEGENSKEVEIQMVRMRREKETIYERLQDIPSDPKEPWDKEMDYDDSLTPVIPMEQSPDNEVTEMLSSPRIVTEGLSAASNPPNVKNTPETPFATITPVAATIPVQISVAVTTPVQASIPATTPTENAPLPDFELLAVLLKNPELVFALTSGQASNLSSADTLQLLDMIKQNGGNLSAVLNGLNADTKEEVVTSLPSPTPSLPSPTPPERSMNGRRLEVVMDSYSQPVSASNRESHSFARAAPTVPLHHLPPTPVMQAQTQRSSFWSPQQSAATNPTQQPPTVTPSQQLQFVQTTTITPSQQVPFVHNFSSGSSPHSNPTASLQHRSESHPPLPLMNPHPNQVRSTINQLQQNFMLAPRPPMQPEPMKFGQMHAVKPAPVSIVLNDRRPIQMPPVGQQAVLLSELPSQQNLHSMQWNSVSTSRQSQTTNSWSLGNQSNLTNSWSHGNQTKQNNYHGNQINQNNYRGNLGVQQPYHTNPTYERNEYVVGEPEYESWSPEYNSLKRSRSPEYRPGQNYSEPKRRSGWDVKPDWSQQQQQQQLQRAQVSGGRDYRTDHKQDNRGRWRDRRH